jgi:hypothetical protein
VITPEQVVSAALEVAGQVNVAPQPNERIDEEPPAKNLFVEVARQVVMASMMTDEGRQCRPRLVYWSPDAPEPAHLAFRFERPAPLTSLRIRTLSFSHNRHHGALVWAIRDAKPVIVGISVLDDPLQRRWPGWLLESPTVGGLEVSYLECLASLRWGELDVYRRGQWPYIESVPSEVTRFFGSPGIPWNKTIREVIRAGHGGSFWIVRDRKNGLAGLTNQYPVESIHGAEHGIAPLWHLAGVDGAVLTDRSGLTIGFGVFSELVDTQVRCLEKNGSYPTKPSSELGGGRHRSAVSFCVNNAKESGHAMAIVVSTDGIVTAVTCVANELPVSATYSRVRPRDVTLRLYGELQRGVPREVPFSPAEAE